MRDLEREVKRGAFAFDALGPHFSAVAADDALDDCQPGAEAWELIRGVQALEDAKQFFDLCSVKARAVIADVKNGTHPNPAFGAEGNVCQRFMTRQFPGVF